MMANREELRKLPSVDRLSGHPKVVELRDRWERDRLNLIIRRVLKDERKLIASGASCSSEEALAQKVVWGAAGWEEPSLKPVINATGVILHTNLGRAPLSPEAVRAMAEAGSGYSNLEFVLEEGQRGSRYVHAEELLCRITGAEAALVVNNNASAVLLVLAGLAHGREVLISRGHLVEIGGGFRLPDVMRQSGARLVEVGTTNRTYLRDYQEAMSEETASILHVHHSNFQMAGFVHETPVPDLAALARRHDAKLVNDLGSGALLDTESMGLAHEPTVQESLADGSDLVCFSGDKLLGGPQAGIIVGDVRLIERLKAHPLTRAIRVDKLVLAGLQATLIPYLNGRATERIPVWQMLASPIEELEARAERWRAELEGQGAQVEVVDSGSTVGGGSLPGQTLPTRALSISVPDPSGLAHRLRVGEVAVVARVEHDKLLLDPRTVLPHQEGDFLGALSEALKG
jgi:L-seryl-tRNA(Ser) seleniumtransferase